jgi:hypothetical protein
MESVCCAKISSGFGHYSNRLGIKLEPSLLQSAAFKANDATGEATGPSPWR